MAERKKKSSRPKQKGKSNFPALGSGSAEVTRKRLKNRGKQIDAMLNEMT